jgi:hypothetical protein
MSKDDAKPQDVAEKKADAILKKAAAGGVRQVLADAAKAAGMTVEEYHAAMERTRDNLRRLQLCGGHVFSDATPGRRVGKSFQCRNCKGVVSAEAAYWYIEGVRHAGIHH